MLKLKSNTLKSYYGETPYEYDIKFIHYNLIIEEESEKELNLLEADLVNINSILGDDFKIYFSDLNNLNIVNKKTSIIDKFKDSIYIRIRNNQEYNQFKNMNCDVKAIVELKNLNNMDLKDESIVLQIDQVAQLPLEKLDILVQKYNIKEIALGQIPYITNESSYLLDIMKKMYNIDGSQLDLEKNNNITNDIYDVETYCKIVPSINDIINKCNGENKITTFVNAFNYIADKIYYDNDGVAETKSENQNLIGPLFNKKSVCEGYSKLLYQVCSLLDIDCQVVSGGGAKEDGGHIWNQVCIDNIWYNADVTLQSYFNHNNENWNACLIPDSYLKYKATSPYAKDCENDYFKEKKETLESKKSR